MKYSLVRFLSYVCYLFSDDRGHAVAILFVNLEPDGHKSQHERPNAQAPDDQLPVEQAIREEIGVLEEANAHSRAEDHANYERRGNDCVNGALRSASLDIRAHRQPGLDVLDAGEAKVRQVVFLGAAIRRQVAEELGVHEALTQSSLGDCQQREEENTEKEGGQEGVQDDE